MANNKGVAAQPRQWTDQLDRWIQAPTPKPRS
ncbi:MAG: hypothetical protein IPL11_13490 [Candidatus Accumulibacter sp.]|nr:hypothetical protein [Accumulibacter sp.]